MNKNKIYLNIHGTEFFVTTDDNESYVREIEREVAASIDTIVGGHTHFSFTMAAVLAALNFCDDARKSSSAANNLRSQLTQYIKDMEKKHQELDETKRENERMKREIQTLKMRLAEADIPTTPEYPYKPPAPLPYQPITRDNASRPRPMRNKNNPVTVRKPSGHDPEENVVADPEDLLTLFQINN